MQRFWNQLAATETLSSFDSTLILDLGSNTHFPHEGSDVQGRLLVRQCYEDLSQMVHDRFAEQLQGLVFIIIGTPGDIPGRYHNMMLSTCLSAPTRDTWCHSVNTNIQCRDRQDLFLVLPHVAASSLWEDSRLGQAGCRDGGYVQPSWSLIRSIVGL